MDKVSMRDWVATLEESISIALKLWKKITHIENGDSIRLAWQFETYHIIVDIDWKDSEERVSAQLNGPRRKYEWERPALTAKTSRDCLERLRNWAQGIMSPPIDPEDAMRPNE